MLRSLSACDPPLSIFIKGIGREKFSPKILYKDFFFDKAIHFELAKETASVALAPKFFLFSLPSKSKRTLSIFSWLSDSKFFNFDAIWLFIFLMALKTLLPKNLFSSLSRNS